MFNLIPYIHFQLRASSRKNLSPHPLNPLVLLLQIQSKRDFEDLSKIISYLPITLSDYPDDSSGPNLITRVLTRFFSGGSQRFEEQGFNML